MIISSATGSTHIDHPADETLPDHLQWKGKGPAPKYWWAKDKPGNPVKVYRSYKDYCDD